MSCGSKIYVKITYFMFSGMTHIYPTLFGTEGVSFYGFTIVKNVLSVLMGQGPL